MGRTINQSLEAKNTMYIYMCDIVYSSYVQQGPKKVYTLFPFNKNFCFVSSSFHLRCSEKRAFVFASSFFRFYFRLCACAVRQLGMDYSDYVLHHGNSSKSCWIRETPEGYKGYLEVVLRAKRRVSPAPPSSPCVRNMCQTSLACETNQEDR